mmetsp:Transcript_45784/g.118338  ORF Transcript_45784/g.118338 Transcript_45784/m.118338 type:complete len:152 (-) Transcript_45784:828-1283(-)
MSSKGGEYDDDVEMRVRKFEEILEKRLSPKLRALLEDRDKVYDYIAQLMQLSNTVELMRSHKGGKMTTQVNIGSNVYGKAKIPHTDRLFVNIGMGFHVELTLAEADAYIAKRKDMLERKGEEMTDEISKVKTDMRMLQEGVADILRLRGSS